MIHSTETNEKLSSGAILLSRPEDVSVGAWPANAELARNYLTRIAAIGAQQLISNVQTKSLVLRDGNFAVPLTVNETEYTNTYVCSPYTAFALYSKAEMRLLENTLLRSSLGVLVDLLGTAMKVGQINKMVQVNNWMFSTNLYDPVWQPDIDNLTKLITQQYPDHFICFRSLNEWSNSQLLTKLRAAGYTLIASRQVYIYEDLESSWRPHKNVQHDLRLLRKTKYSVVYNNQILETDYGRMAELYDLLYRQKYPEYNPAFTPEFIRHSHEIGLLHYQGLRNGNGVLDGVVGMFRVGDVTSAPIVGYDIALSQKLGLYRLLITLIFLTATKEKCAVNLSSGAASFKRLRGGAPIIEYSAVYDKHLSPVRRAMLQSIAGPVNKIGIPLLQKLKL
ncbi:MAG: hypothetical protein P4L53_26395 [Candidatus Obscuribacterales bacterium]|nr:hypothetical protein [Candidatus Obscuribacterales bacterium]